MLASTVPRKGKTQKHTAKEIAQKHKAAKERAGAAGGGGAGAAARVKEQAKALGICNLCKTQQPSIASMKIHYEGKHDRVNWEEEKAQYEEMFGAIKLAVKGDQLKKSGGAVKMTKEEQQAAAETERLALQAAQDAATGIVVDAGKALSAMSFGTLDGPTKKVRNVLSRREVAVLSASPHHIFVAFAPRATRCMQRACAPPPPLPRAFNPSSRRRRRRRSLSKHAHIDIVHARLCPHV